MKRMNGTEVRAFLYGKTLFIYEPETLKSVAKVTYGSDGRCTALFADGSSDAGQFGFSGDTYWTKYDRFRSGETNHFYLVPVEPEVAQAFHADGRRAFLQSPLSSLKIGR